jgi:hypothetical protein
MVGDFFYPDQIFQEDIVWQRKTPVKLQITLQIFQEKLFGNCHTIFYRGPDQKTLTKKD